ncbi:MAG: hypothetical protein WD267_11465 [Balneolales bacterium]
MEIIGLINTSIGIVKRLREISKNIEVAEFNNLLAELANKLADSKMEVADLKTTILQLEEKINRLESKNSAKSKILGVKWGCYQFEDMEGLFCPRCFDVDGRQILTSRLRSGKRKCPQCNAELS